MTTRGVKVAPMTPLTASALAIGILAIAAVVMRGLHRGLERVSIDLSGIDVSTAMGEIVRIGPLVDRPTILVLPRYYG